LKHSHEKTLKRCRAANVAADSESRDRLVALRRLPRSLADAVAGRRRKAAERTCQRRKGPMMGAKPAPAYVHIMQSESALLI
jgi:hypothetical protein